MPLSNQQKSLIAAALGGTACLAIAFLLTHHRQPTEISGTTPAAPAHLFSHYHKKPANPSLHQPSESPPLAHTTAKARPTQPPPLQNFTALQKSPTKLTTTPLIDRHDGPPIAAITSTSTAPILSNHPISPLAHQITPPEATTSPPPLIVPFSADDPSTPATIPATLAAPITAPTETHTPSDQTPDLGAVIQDLASQFLNEIEGEGSDDSTHPAYQRRWLDAQVENDARLRASLGGHAWLKLHQEAHQQALRDQSAESSDDKQ